jgi:uncharacterized protein (DUF2062 family)
MSRIFVINDKKRKIQRRDITMKTKTQVRKAFHCPFIVKTKRWLRVQESRRDIANVGLASGISL